MRTPTTIKSHPLHPMLIVFPLGLWFYSFVAQLISLDSTNPAWYATALYTAGGGIIGALLAAIPGTIDVFSIRDRRIRSIGYRHMVLNLIALGLWIAVFFLLRADNPNQTLAFIISLISVVVLLYSGWLGGTLAHENRVGVAEPHEQEHIAATQARTHRE